MSVQIFDVKNINITKYQKLNFHKEQTSNIKIELGMLYKIKI